MKKQYNAPKFTLLSTLRDEFCDGGASGILVTPGGETESGNFDKNSQSLPMIWLTKIIKNQSVD